MGDPRPLAEAIRTRAAGLRLAPKVSVVVDGGGVLHLDALAADMRLRAVGARWEVWVGGRFLGSEDAAGATATVLRALERLAALGPAARGRDLTVAAAVEAPAPARGPAVPVGRLAGGALGIGLPFGQIGLGRSGGAGGGER